MTPVRARKFITQKWQTIACTLWTLLAVAGCAPQGEQAVPDELPHNVRVLALTTTTLTEYFEISGPVAPVRGTDVSAEEAGTVVAIPHDKGERVKAGEILVELDRRLLKAEMESAAANLELQHYNHEQTRRLFDAEKVSRFELLTTKAQFEQAQALSEITRLRYERAAVKAPFGGLVTDRYIEPGQLVAPGTPVARVIDPFTLKLVGSLTEREVGWVRPGSEAKVMLDGYDWPVTGRVHWVGFEADAASGKFEVEIYIDNPDLSMRSGVVGRARILKRENQDVLAIPRDAVLPNGSESTVYVVQDDRAVLRPVALGPDQGVMVVVASGLQPGELLVVRGQRELVDGAKVVVTEEATSADGSNGSDPQEVRSGRSQRHSWREQEGGA